MLRIIQHTHVAASNVGHKFAALLEDKCGATAIEYGLIAAGISIAVIGTVFTLGDEVGNTFGEVQTAISSQ